MTSQPVRPALADFFGCLIPECRSADYAHCSPTSRHEKSQPHHFGRLPVSVQATPETVLRISEGHLSKKFRNGFKRMAESPGTCEWGAHLGPIIGVTMLSSLIEPAKLLSECLGSLAMWIGAITHPQHRPTSPRQLCCMRKGDLPVAPIGPVSGHDRPRTGRSVQSRLPPVRFRTLPSPTRARMLSKRGGLGGQLLADHGLPGPSDVFCLLCLHLFLVTICTVYSPQRIFQAGAWMVSASS